MVNDDAPGTLSGAIVPAFSVALDGVTAAEWAAWMGETPELAAVPRLRCEVVAIFPLPPTPELAAICLLQSPAGEGPPALHQAALRLWTGSVPPGARVLHRHSGSTGSPEWTLAGAWSDPELCNWLRTALSAGASLRAAGWEWLSAPERPAAGQTTGATARQIEGRRHDVVLFAPGAVAIVYSKLTPGGQPELDVLRHLERVPGVRVAPVLLGSAIVRSPSGQRSASAALEAIVAGAATVRSVLVGRLRRALDGDPSLQAVALDDVRAVGVITRELHAALGRPLDEGVLAGARPATASDVEIWVARAWTALSDATRALGGASTAPTPLRHALDTLPAKLQQFAAAAEHAPGLIHRIHGSLRLDSVLMSPPRQLSIVEFDGDMQLSDAERAAPQSPWRDVGRLLVSLAESAAEAAFLAGGDEKAFEIAWLWEREARKAYLEGYGTGGGALHALIAIAELEFASRTLRDAVRRDTSLVVASHILLRLTRTIV